MGRHLEAAYRVLRTIWKKRMELEEFVKAETWNKMERKVQDVAKGMMGAFLLLLENGTYCDEFFLLHFICRHLSEKDKAFALFFIEILFLNKLVNERDNRDETPLMVAADSTRHQLPPHTPALLKHPPPFLLS